MHDLIEENIPDPTDEQQFIIDTVRSTEENVMVVALAGTGKSTTLMLMFVADRRPIVLAGHAEAPTILCVAFNTRIVKDMTAKKDAWAKKLGIDLSHIEVRTLNGVGHRAWGSTISKKLVVDKDKTRNMLASYIRDNLKGTDKEDAWSEVANIRDAIASAKNKGYIPEGKFENARHLITREDFYDSLEEELTPFTQKIVDHILTESIKAAYNGLIDFDDQIYMSALFGGTFPRFPLVAIDEVQDLNAVNHEMLTKLAKGRLFGAGDDAQSIYAFRGAVPGSMAKLQKQFNMLECKLTNTFRCPEAVVRIAQARVPQYRSRKPGGTYAVLGSIAAREIRDNSAIICRNNAPLFGAAFNLLKAGRSVTVVGSDIGPRILAIMRKLGVEDTPRDRLEILIDRWLDEKLERAKNTATVVDMAECMRVFASRGRTLGQAVAWAEDLFIQQGSITLITGHKAKGLEWDVVYHLDPQLIRVDKDIQEANLRYVITTRAKDSLYEIASDSIVWE